MVHDSVLRYCYRASDWRPEVMRSTFTLIVNGKKPLLDFEGSEFPAWKSKLARHLWFAMLTMLLLIVLVMITAGGPNISYKQWTWLMPVAPAFFYLYYGARLTGKTHRTTFSTKNGARWTTAIITAERDEEGLSTRNVKVDGKPVGADATS